MISRFTAVQNVMKKSLKFDLGKKRQIGRTESMNSAWSEKFEFFADLSILCSPERLEFFLLNYTVVDLDFTYI